MPLIHRPGEAQIDFFEVVVEVGGERRKAWEFLLRLMYSGREFAWWYERCDQLAFLDGHVRAFAHLGGVARRCVYDNLAAAVRKIVGARRELTGRFLALVSHYLFEPDFARIGEGHDKGGVESRGKAIRLEHLTPIPRGDSLEAISRQLLAELDTAFATRHDAGTSASARWAEERVQLLPVPATRFEVRKPLLVEISSRAMVRIEGAWYSVASRWARLNATAYLGVDDVRIVCMGESVTHPRARLGTRQVPLGSPRCRNGKRSRVLLSVPFDPPNRAGGRGGSTGSFFWYRLHSWIWYCDETAFDDPFFPSETEIFSL